MRKKKGIEVISSFFEQNLKPGRSLRMLKNYFSLKQKKKEKGKKKLLNVRG